MSIDTSTISTNGDMHQIPTRPQSCSHTRLISRAERNYEGKRWVSYHRQFRREALARKDLNWSVTNHRLYNEAFTGHLLGANTACKTTTWQHIALEYLAILERECRILGIPIAAHKWDGPTTLTIFLGYEIDTVAGITVRFLRRLLSRGGHTQSNPSPSWSVCSPSSTYGVIGNQAPAKSLEPLIGLLNHARKVVR